MSIRKLLIILLIFLNHYIYATTYYVKPDGDDGNSGLNWANAWKTIQKAANTMTNGDTVLVAAGVYNSGGGTADTYSARVLITNSGTSLAPITYKAFTNGAIIDASGLNCGIHIYKADYIVIDGFEVRNANNNGICLNTSAKYNTIKNCIVYSNSINGISIGRCWGPGSDWDARGNCDNTVIKKCSVNNNFTGIFIYCSAGCTIESNLCHNNTGKGGISTYARGSSTAINYLRYNICYSNNYGVELSYKNERGDQNDTIIENCVLSFNTLDGVFAGCAYTKVKNCIIFKNGRYGLREDRLGWQAWTTDLQSTYNDVCSNTSGNYFSNGDGLSPGIGDISFDPLFKTLMTGVWDTSFLLKCKYNNSYGLTGDAVTSPCIDNGDPSVSVALPDLRSDIGALNITNTIGYPDKPYNLGPSYCTNGSVRTITVVTLNFTLHDAVVPSSMDKLRYRVQLSTNASFTSLVVDYTSSFAAMGNRSYISPSLPSGSYYWRVMAEDDKQGTYGNKSGWSYANNGNVAFVIVAVDAPVLSWIGSGDFTSAGVSPTEGKSGEKYEFRVRYTDKKNNPPVTRELWVDLNDNGSYEDDGEKISMEEVDPSDTIYTNGKDYRKSIVINYAGDGIINYKFYYNNGTKDAIGEPTKEHQLKIENLSQRSVRIVDNVIRLNKNSKCKVIFKVDKPTTVEMRVYDITAKLVKVIKQDTVSVGTENEIFWDGKDENGKKVGYGVYLLYFKAGELELKEKVAVIK